MRLNADLAAEAKPRPGIPINQDKPLKHTRGSYHHCPACQAGNSSTHNPKED
jgi:hypothetical protein